MTMFYKIANKGEDPNNQFSLKDLGKQIKCNRLVNHGHGVLGMEEYYRLTTQEDYDKSFVSLLLETKPIFKITDLLNFHLEHYDGSKIEFIAQIKYIILPLVKKEKDTEGYIQLINDWLDKKEPKSNQMAKNVYKIKTRDINAPTQFQQNSDNSVQNQNLNYNEAIIKELFEALEPDIERLAIDIKEDFSSEMSYALKQIKQGKDIKSQLLNIGSLISNVGLPFFVNLVSSGAFEVMKPYLGLP